MHRAKADGVEKQIEAVASPRNHIFVNEINLISAGLDERQGPLKVARVPKGYRPRNLGLFARLAVAHRTGDDANPDALRRC